MTMCPTHRPRRCPGLRLPAAAAARDRVLRLGALASPLPSAALGHIQFKAGQPCYLPAASRSARPRLLDPQLRSIGADEAVDEIPRILAAQTSSRLERFFGDRRHGPAPARPRTTPARRRQNRIAPGTRYPNRPRSVWESHVQEPPAGSAEREAKPVLAFAQVRLGSRAFDCFPDAFGDITDERDLGRRPDAGGDVVRAKRGHHPPVLDQRHTDERGDLTLVHCATLDVRESRIRCDVVHHCRFASLVSLA